TSTFVASYENELGVIAPTGFFDPFGLSEDIDQVNFDQYRAAELKRERHCKPNPLLTPKNLLSMLAVVGYVATDTYHFPFDIAPGVACAYVPSGVAAINAIPALGWAKMFFVIGAVDYYGYLGRFDRGMPDLGEKVEERKLQELQHGRLAVLAVLELLRHD
ncbi:fucoxanthin chl a/c protein-deviant sequence, partial [Thalassiosira pseudonana CCMP1335]